MPPHVHCSAIQGLLRKLGGSGNSALEEMLHGTAGNNQRMKVWAPFHPPSGASVSPRLSATQYDYTSPPMYMDTTPPHSAVSPDSLSLQEWVG